MRLQMGANPPIDRSSPRWIEQALRKAEDKDRALDTQLELNFLGLPKLRDHPGG